MSIDNLGIASVGSIVIIAYLCGMIAKSIPSVEDKLIPCIVGVVGCVLGIVAYAFKIPAFPGDTDILTAMAIGIVSGLAATGINQIGKQLSA